MKVVKRVRGRGGGDIQMVDQCEVVLGVGVEELGGQS